MTSEETSPTKEDSSPAAALPSKRFSPWRQPKDARDPESAASLSWSSSRPHPATNHPPTKSTKQKSTRKLFQEFILVQIPLNVTADLGVAIRRTRQKRIKGLLKAFPQLNQQKSTTDDPPMEDGVKGDLTQDKSEEESKAQNKKKKKKRNQPQPGDFGNIVDYLEAKYVQGVMVDDSGSEDDNEEGQGSVYSETSFLDDTDLQRTVAEQVLAQTTTTKLELRDDGEFFVNVGELEIEETDLTKDEYDPLQDTKTKSPKRKRKDAEIDKEENAKKKKKVKPELADKKGKAVPTSTKSAKASTSEESQKPDTAKTGSSKDTQKKSKECKKIYENLYQKLVEMIKKASPEELPKRKTKDKVSIKCPDDKKPGDTVIFANPHVRGQKLKVKIPDNCKPGGTFKVTVPIPIDEDDDTDYNKLSRDFYSALEVYSRAFDEWCEAEGDYRKAIDDTDFTAHFEKRKKFDKLVNEFPKDLKTPVDKSYLQKILRRARQSKSRKEAGQDKSDLSVASESFVPTTKAFVPVASKNFTQVEFNMNDFKL
ncbi:hypothetical protein FisN_3Hh238 [Fistulifera solaris]|uniref:Uncharacterized protein n=1 Tax=Fistulifera solaris TaxID=1519565 RepID=A0A1Z5JQP7_FISSO|nr:hypothetical protein FisN_3Hh238 [Fistulifera solaris]|eukprot:GAX16279.1 hypothetical protein FisN_3Hh238 [Fistulifera solaris]